MIDLSEFPEAIERSTELAAEALAEEGDYGPTAEAVARSAEYDEALRRQLAAAALGVRTALHEATLALERLAHARGVSPVFFSAGNGEVAVRTAQHLVLDALGPRLVPERPERPGTCDRAGRRIQLCLAPSVAQEVQAYLQRAIPRPDEPSWEALQPLREALDTLAGDRPGKKPEACWVPRESVVRFIAFTERSSFVDERGSSSVRRSFSGGPAERARRMASDLEASLALPEVEDDLGDEVRIPFTHVQLAAIHACAVRHEAPVQPWKAHAAFLEAWRKLERAKGCPESERLTFDETARRYDGALRLPRALAAWLAAWLRAMDERAHEDARRRVVERIETAIEARPGR